MQPSVLKSSHYAALSTSIRGVPGGPAPLFFMKRKLKSLYFKLVKLNSTFSILKAEIILLFVTFFISFVRGSGFHEGGVEGELRWVGGLFGRQSSN